MTLSELKALIGKGRMPTLEIHAFEGIIYLVKIITDVGETMLKKDDGDNQVFKSSTQAGIAPSLRTPMDLRLLAGLG